MMQTNVTKNTAPNILQLIFWLVANLMVWSIIAGFVSYAVAIILVAVRGEQYSIRLLQHLMQQDNHYLWLHLCNTASFITLQQWNDGLNNILLSLNTATLSSLIPPGMQQTMHILWVALLPYVKIIFVNSELLLLRLYLLYCWLPVMGLIGSIGIVDGLVARSIRRVSMGRESATIYFQAKAFALFSLIAGIFLVLSLPISFKQSEAGFVIAISIFAIALYTSAKQFKKYL